VELHECLQALTTEAVLREKIRWVDLAVDFAKVDASKSDSLLDP